MTLPRIAGYPAHWSRAQVEEFKNKQANNSCSPTVNTPSAVPSSILASSSKPPPSDALQKKTFFTRLPTIPGIQTIKASAEKAFNVDYNHVVSFSSNVAVRSKFALAVPVGAVQTIARLIAALFALITFPVTDGVDFVFGTHLRPDLGKKWSLVKEDLISTLACLVGAVASPLLIISDPKVP